MRLIIPAAGSLSMAGGPQRSQRVGKRCRQGTEMRPQDRGSGSMDQIGLKRFLRKTVRVGGNDRRRRHHALVQLQFEQSRALVGWIPVAAEDEVAERVRDGRALVDLDALQVMRM